MAQTDTNMNIPAMVKPITNVSPAKIAACKTKEAVVKTRMKQLTELVNTMVATFDDIAGRVETYYSKMVIPTGKTVTNYDTLAGAITSQKTSVKARLSQTETDVDNFNCTNENPKTLINQFKADMQAEKTDLKNYRTSITDLIVAIKTVSRTAQNTPTNTK